MRKRGRSMFRNATMADLDQVAAIYDRIHTE